MKKIFKIKNIVKAVFLLIVLFLFTSAKTPEVNWKNYDEAIQFAKKSNKHILLYFYTDWCSYCALMKKTTLADARVVSIINEKFSSVLINAESKKVINKKGADKTGIDFAKSYQVNSFPTTWFLLPDGKPLTNLPGYVASKEFFIILSYISSKAYEKQTYAEYAKNFKG